MSALRALVTELRRQADLLDWAESRDGLAAAILNGHGTAGGQRRIWTRQDLNRRCQDDLDDYFASDFDTARRRGEPPPLELQIVLSARTDTRLSRILQRLPGIAPFRQAALTESQQQNTYAVIAPIVVEATQAHIALVALWEEGIGDWNEVERRHDDALKAIDMHIPADESTIDLVPIAIHVPRTNSTVNTWTQIEVDAAVQRYWDKHLEAYNAAIAGRGGARAVAVKLFSQRTITSQCGISTKTLVGKSPVYCRLANALGTRRKGTAKGHKIGAVVAIDLASEASGDATSADVIHRETVRLIQSAMPSEEATATIERLQNGELSDDAARELAGLAAEQRRDSRASRAL